MSDTGTSMYCSFVENTPFSIPNTSRFQFGTLKRPISKDQLCEKGGKKQLCVYTSQPECSLAWLCPWYERSLPVYHSHEDKTSGRLL